MNKININDKLGKYTFLNVIDNPHGEETEVTQEAVEKYHKYYQIYNNGWEVKEYNKFRRQTSTKGSWLLKVGETTIDIAGDILTSKKVFMSAQKVEGLEELYSLFERLYHTIGNCIPWCEGANMGGGPCKRTVIRELNKETPLDYLGLDYEKYGFKISTDTFTRKLKLCKDVFDDNFDKSCINDEYVRARIERCIEGKGTLGNAKGKKCLHFWIKKEWIGKKEGADRKQEWKNFVVKNYLLDMVDENYEPIECIIGMSESYQSKEIRYQDMKDSLIRSIRLIIKRGYRIENGIERKFSKTEERYLQDIFVELGKFVGVEISGKD